jgi:hypothetical protein
LRLQQKQTTTTNSINTTAGTTIAITIIVELESSSLLDNAPRELNLADDVGEVAMVVFGLKSHLIGLAVGFILIDGNWQAVLVLPINRGTVCISSVDYIV